MPRTPRDTSIQPDIITAFEGRAKRGPASRNRKRAATVTESTGGETTGRGIVRLRAEGEATSLFGDTYVVKAAGEETGGTLAVIEADLATHSGGTPLHANTLEDENYYVIDGTLTFRLDERSSKPPREHSSTFRRARYIPMERDGRASQVIGVSRSGWFRELLADLAGLMDEMPPGPPDMSRLSEIYEKYGLRVVRPPPNS